jgi:hypothetical protein
MQMQGINERSQFLVLNQSIEQKCGIIVRIFHVNIFF